MKRNLVLIIAVLVILGSAAAVWFFFIEAETPAEKAAAEAPPPPEPILLTLDTISVPVIREGRIAKYVMLQLSLEMEDEEAKAVAEEQMPRLKDALFRTIYDYFANQAPGQQGINMNQIASRLKRASDRAIGPGRVKKVLIQGAYERRRT